MSDRNEADGYIKAAKELVGKTGFLSKLFGSSDNAYKAVELFQKAGNWYTVAKMWKDGGDAYLEAAKISESILSNNYGAMENYSKAANCYRKEAPLDSVKYYQMVIKQCIDLGSHSIAAKNSAVCAEVYENELQDIPKSIEFYQKAADLYLDDGSPANANKYLLKVAERCAIQREYAKAIDIYEKVGKYSIGNDLLKYAAKDYFFKASLVALAYDVLEAQKAICGYCEASNYFKTSGQCTLVKKILQSVEDEDSTIFDDAIKEYLSVNQMDEWTQTMITRIRESIGQSFDIT
ncbi:Beta-soluble NSF attachment protein [Thelohanellus kitauei]|uniref:Beta-soluble NSF attachment protein n=1 Tax=Thelohanellus kitauei TaxID=669202 RepID=A0A0C2JG72_THEKT|nr:Beta-soluble NSF attachment protein [Thelohanellus kitauei]